MKLQDIAIARSGDKGNRATLSVVARDRGHYALLERLLTAERVQAHYRGIVRGRVQRYPLPHLGAVHFVMDEALGGGVTRSLALDAHGKTLSAAILDLDIDLDEVDLAVSNAVSNTVSNAADNPGPGHGPLQNALYPKPGD